MRLVHVISQLSRGGASRALVTLARELSASSRIRQQIVSLLPPSAQAAAMAAASLDVVSPQGDGDLDELMAGADIVHLHFWNTPDVYRFIGTLVRPSRVLLTCHVAGDSAPQVLTRRLVEWADQIVAACPFTAELPVLRERTGPDSNAAAMIYDVADFRRLEQLPPQPHSGIRVGYIGEVDFVKLRPEFVSMSARTAAPIKFIVHGSGDGAKVLARQAETLGVSARFTFGGYVEDIGSALSTFDLFGYPLCADTYAASEQVLQEAMYAAVPPVVLPHGGVRSLVRHGETGIVAGSAEEYSDAIDALAVDPELRGRLGRNAAAYAREEFGIRQAAASYAREYDRLMERPRRPRTFPRASGAALFIESLGDLAGPFTDSMSAVNADAAAASDEAIANAGHTLIGPACGGILHYRRAFPDDCWLRFWSGLVLQRQGRPALAAGEFVEAIRLGCPATRVHGHLLAS